MTKRNAIFNALNCLLCLAGMFTDLYVLVGACVPFFLFTFGQLVADICEYIQMNKKPVEKVTYKITFEPIEEKSNNFAWTCPVSL